APLCDRHHPRGGAARLLHRLRPQRAQTQRQPRTARRDGIPMIADGVDRVIGDRHAGLELMRAAYGFGAVALAAFAGSLPVSLLMLAVGYLAFGGSLAFTRTRAPDVVTVSMMWWLLVDGAFLVAAVAMTGGPRSPLAVLVFVHVSATTLVVSHAAGVRVAA